MVAPEHNLIQWNGVLVGQADQWPEWVNKGSEARLHVEPCMPEQPACIVSTPELTANEDQFTCIALAT